MAYSSCDIGRSTARGIGRQVEGTAREIESARANSGQHRGTCWTSMIGDALERRPTSSAQRSDSVSMAPMKRNPCLPGIPPSKRNVRR
jgi:hypothetical protein